MVVIKTDHITTRLEYVSDFIFQNLFNCRVKLIVGDELENPSDAIIYYTKVQPEKGWWIQPIGLLELRPPNEDDQSAGLALCQTILNAIDTKDLGNIDIFSFVFFCISRYEEYQPFNSDHFGRFHARSSVAYRLGFLERPLVEELISLFGEKLQSNYPGLDIYLKSQYRLISTIDIDQAWAYKHKGLRNLGGIGRELMKGDFRHLWRRIRVISGFEPDPFDTYEFIQNLHDNENINPRFFILVAAKKNKLDKNHNPANRQFRQLIEELAKSYEIGIHPSYRSNKNKEVLENEKQELEKITHKKITSSRQHFLMLKLPNTYRNLSLCGIRDDYSMGYADKPGYRASTGHSFLWYDVYREQVTSLKVHPFQVMDVTLKNYNKLSPAHSIAVCRKMIESAKKWGSPFCIIWHNSSLDEKSKWAGWSNVYMSVIQIASKQKALES